MGSGFGVKGVKCSLEVVRKPLESLLVCRDSGIGYFVIPHLGEGCTTTFTHLVECDHDFVVVCGV